jgi:hypothetical protein
LAPDLKKLGSSEVRRMMEGKFLPIDKALRQHRSSRTEQNLITLGGGYSLSTTNGRVRTVHNHFTWFEAFLSSIMPILIILASKSTTLDECKQRIAVIEQHISYALAALTYFQKYSFVSVKNYLDTHRETCIDNNRDISVPDSQMYVLMQQQSSPATSTPPSSSSTSSSSSTASSSTNTASQSNSSAHRNKNDRSSTYTGNECGKFNSFDGCKNNACKFKHSCRHCKQDGHGQTNCDLWKATRPQPKKK